MMHDIHADTQRERQLEHARLYSPKEDIDILGESMAGLSGLSL
jgi:hypothetical protein